LSSSLPGLYFNFAFSGEAAAVFDEYAKDPLSFIKISLNGSNFFLFKIFDLSIAWQRIFQL